MDTATRRVQRTALPSQATACVFVYCPYNIIASKARTCDDPRGNKTYSDARCFNLNNKEVLCLLGLAK